MSVKQGETIVVHLHDEESGYLVKVEGEQKIGKTRVSVKGLVGSPFGSIFQIVDRKLEYLESSEDLVTSLIGTVEDDPSRGDNRSYIDSNTAQKLGDDEIRELREAGMSGEEIIRTLMSNSDTFNSKTAFAQAKWIKRKQKKYVRRIRISKATPLSVCDVYHFKNKEKICNLRSDTLAQIMSQSGIYSGCRVLVVDSVLGLAVGSVAYRLRGEGHIFAAYAGQQPHFELVDALNLDASSVSIIQPVPSAELGPASEHTRLHGFEPHAALDNAVFDPEKKPHNCSGRQPHELPRVRAGLRQGFQSLIIVCKFNPLPILRETLELLGPSCPFVVFSEYMEPLVSCYLYLQQFGLALRMQICDTWTREFQVLSGRVHPQMYMSTSGGYLLTGIHVKSSTVQVEDQTSMKRQKQDEL